MEPVSGVTTETVGMVSFIIAMPPGIPPGPPPLFPPPDMAFPTENTRNNTATAAAPAAIFFFLLNPFQFILFMALIIFSFPYADNIFLRV